MMDGNTSMSVVCYKSPTRLRNGAGTEGNKRAETSSHLATKTMWRSSTSNHLYLVKKQISEYRSGTVPIIRIVFQTMPAKGTG